ncbi:hypothetical protein EF384_03280 [Aerococcus agrisoli]|uniref:PPM-type phosphatase domain-containing protein n=1 Tax=Aerococcus agrisoli TaxID=2487350 RepID=A0A3N4GGB9_9LACT|nr:hypothetical protein [Aerococcus agrisoli]RPA60888.1 hypothetical protein EF384_03280 [Aerococcus agrisoli]
MQIQHTFIQGKFDDPTQCEDAIFYNDHFVAIIDGVTAKSDYRYEGLKTGKIASLIIQDYLATVDPTASIQEIIHGINTAFEDQFYNKVDFPLDRVSHGPQAAMILYSNFHHKIYIIGDSQALVNGQLHTQPKASDEILSNFRSLVLHIDPSQHEEARAAILPYLISSNTFANTTGTRFGYSVLNGQEIPDALIKVIDIKDGDHIIFTSDGYPTIKEDFAATEAYLQHILTNDPDLITEYLSTKGLQEGQVSFDDRSYIEFVVD